MRYVIIRDDDANGLTDPDQLELLYRPFLARGLPVQLAAIPAVQCDARSPEGELEGFLGGPDAGRPGTRPLVENQRLLTYLEEEPRYGIAQHGLHHALIDGAPEFAGQDGARLASMLDEGSRHLRDAGIDRPKAFVAPQDQLSRVAVREIRRRFPILSTGYYDLRRIPRRLWAQYLVQKKLQQRTHFTLASQVYLTHPGCILSYRRPVEPMLGQIDDLISRHRLLVIVSHHWEFFAGGQRNDALIGVLHALAERLATRGDVQVIDFARAADVL